MVYLIVHFKFWLRFTTTVTFFVPDMVFQAVNFKVYMQYTSVRQSLASSDRNQVASLSMNIETVATIIIYKSLYEIISQCIIKTGSLIINYN